MHQYVVNVGECFQGNGLVAPFQVLGSDGSSAWGEVTILAGLTPAQRNQLVINQAVSTLAAQSPPVTVDVPGGDEIFVCRGFV